MPVAMLVIVTCAPLQLENIKAVARQQRFPPPPDALLDIAAFQREPHSNSSKTAEVRCASSSSGSTCTAEAICKPTTVATVEADCVLSMCTCLQAVVSAADVDQRAAPAKAEENKRKRHTLFLSTMLQHRSEFFKFHR